MAKKTYIVQSPVNHDNKMVAVGEKITLEQEQAEPLLDCGAIANPEKGKPAADSDDASPSVSAAEA